MAERFSRFFRCTVISLIIVTQDFGDVTFYISQSSSCSYGEQDGSMACPWSSLDQAANWVASNNVANADVTFKFFDGTYATTNWQMNLPTTALQFVGSSSAVTITNAGSFVGVKQVTFYTLGLYNLTLSGGTSASIINCWSRADATFGNVALKADQSVVNIGQSSFQNPMHRVILSYSNITVSQVSTSGYNGAPPNAWQLDRCPSVSITNSHFDNHINNPISISNSQVVAISSTSFSNNTGTSGFFYIQYFNLNDTSITNNNNVLNADVFQVENINNFNLKNVTFAGNSGYSGGMAVRSSSIVTLTGCHVTNNTAGVNGGGLNFVSVNTAVLSDTFVGWNAAPSAGGQGGGIFVDGPGNTGNLQLENVNFTGNSVGSGSSGNSQGGGIFVNGMIVEISGCYFSGNRAIGNGGGLSIIAPVINFVENSVVTLKSNQFLENFSPIGAAIFIRSEISENFGNRSALFDNLKVIGNSATFSTIFLQSMDHVTIISGIFTGNSILMQNCTPQCGTLVPLSSWIFMNATSFQGNDQPDITCISSHVTSQGSNFQGNFGGSGCQNCVFVQDGNSVCQTGSTSTSTQSSSPIPTSTSTSTSTSLPTSTSTSTSNSSSSSSGNLETEDQLKSSSSENWKFPVYIASGAVAIVIIVIFACVIFKLKRRKSRRSSEESPGKVVENSEIEMVTEHDYTPISLRNSVAAMDTNLTGVNVGTVIGSGNFGEVYRGTWKTQIVALKKLRQENPQIEKEIFILKNLSHPNIVRYYGTCRISGSMYMVMQYASDGCLQVLLGEDPESSAKFPILTLLTWMRDVTFGMSYLAQKNIIHKDLALRNLLLSRDASGELIVLISDFGMSSVLEEKDYYKLSSDQAELPIRWTAPETLTHGRQSVASDVWSFGVVLWETFSYGGRPYAGLSNVEVVDFILAGNVMRKPSGCSPEIYEIMRDCWKLNPQERPHFRDLYDKIDFRIQKNTLR